MRRYVPVLLLGCLIGCGEPEVPSAGPAPIPERVEAPPRPPAPDAGPREKGAIVEKAKGGFTRIDYGKKAAARRDLARDKPAFYPVLRNFEAGDLFAKTVVHRPVAAGLGVFACRKTRSPSGGIGIDYVLQGQLKDYGLDGPKVLDLCYENFFKDKIEVKAAKQGDDLLLQFISSGGLPTALLGHPSTYGRFSEQLKAEDMAILIDGPEVLVATRVGSSFAAKFPELVAKSHHKQGVLNLDPAVYHWNKKDGLKLMPGPGKPGAPKPPAPKGS